MERISRSRTLHAAVAAAMADVCTDAGLLVPPPQAAFYLYADFDQWRDYLQSKESGISYHMQTHYRFLLLVGQKTCPANWPEKYPA